MSNDFLYLIKCNLRIIFRLEENDMGQYFKAYVENSASKSLGRMMEFGYMHQSYVATICTMIYQNPQIVAFVGDYLQIMKHMMLHGIKAMRN